MSTKATKRTINEMEKVKRDPSKPVKKDKEPTRFKDKK